MLKFDPIYGGVVGGFHVFGGSSLRRQPGPNLNVGSPPVKPFRRSPFRYVSHCTSSTGHFNSPDYISCLETSVDLGYTMVFSFVKSIVSGGSKIIPPVFILTFNLLSYRHLRVTM